MPKKFDSNYLVEIDPKPTEYADASIMAHEDPRSVVNMVSEEMKKHLLAIPEKTWMKNEGKLKRDAEADATDCRLRLAFWDEYTKAQDKGMKMRMERITAGICHREYFYSVVTTNPHKLAFICTPPKDYIVAMREMLDMGLDRLRDILETPFITEKVFPIKDKDTGEKVFMTVKQVDAKVMSEIRQTVQYLDARVKGAIIQRVAVQQKNLNVNVDAPDQLTADETLAQLEKLENKLEKVKKLTASMEGKGSYVIDAETT